MLVLGTDTIAPSIQVFQGLLESTKPAYTGHSALNLLLLVTRLQRLIRVKHNDDCARLIRKCHSYCLRYRVYNSSTRISTRFPFHESQLRLALGPTNPQLTNSAEEPLPLRRQGFSPCYAATVSRILISGRSTRLCNRASARSERLVTKQLHSEFSVVSVTGLVPSIFTTQALDR